MLIVAVRAAGRFRNTQNVFRLLAFDTSSLEVPARELGQCAGGLVAFDDDRHGIFSVEYGDGAGEVVLRDLTGSTILRSPAFSGTKGEFAPAVSYYHSSGLLAVLHAAEPAPKLFLWRVGEEGSRDVPLPSDFRPNGAMHPFITDRGTIVIAVAQDCNEFAGLNLNTLNWSYGAVQPKSDRWAWKSWAPAEQRKDAWVLSDWSGLGSTPTYVNSQGLHLWAPEHFAVDYVPGLGVRPSDFLEHLDVTQMLVVGPEEGRDQQPLLSSGGPIVYGRVIAQVSGDARAERVAVIYRHEGNHGDCVAWVHKRAEGDHPYWYWDEHTVYEDGGVPPNCALAMSPKGNLLAVPHVNNSGQLTLNLFKLPELTQIASWPLEVAWE